MSARPGQTDIAFLFVVDGHRLEIQSLFLVATLRHFHPDAALIAYVSNATNARMSQAVLQLFETCGVERRLLPDHGDTWKRDYPHGNKLFAMSDKRESTYSIFLDTDMVACSAIQKEHLPGPFEISVVPEGAASWGKDDDRWERAYAHYGLDLPAETVTLTRRKRLEFLPYFNAGFVAMREQDRVESKSFGSLWLETASDFDHNCAIGGKRPWLDQITLPIAMKRFGFQYKVVGPECNFSISNRAPEADATPIILHYHKARFLRPWPQWEQTKNILRGMTGSDSRGALDKLLAGSDFELT
jgi:hypothetical protein